MTQEDKELLLKDLCARLPYRVLVHHPDYDEPECLDTVLTPDAWMEGGIMCTIDDYWDSPHDIRSCKPYLRPMSSMTEEEKKDLLVTIVGNKGSKYFQVLSDGSIDNTDAAHQDLDNFTMHWINFDGVNTASYVDWCNKNHFDYRGLIEKGLAIEAHEGMYEH